MRAELLAPRTARKADYKAMLSVIGGDVPNRYGHFELAWKKAHGHHGVKLSEDWFTDLLALPSRQVSKVLRPIYRDCVIQAALLRAASSIGAEPARTDEVVEVLLAAAYLHESTFRDEVGRAIRRLGDPALPGLLRRSVRPPLPADEGEAQVVKDSVAYRTAEYAGYQIDRMDRAHPRKALQAVSDDPARLAELLAAYGMVRSGDAAGPLLDFVDAAIPPVREAARQAFLAYVSGPAPRAERKLLRFVGGGTGESAAQLTYRDLARIAIMSRIASNHPELAEPDCRSAPKDSVFAEACEAQPERLARSYFERLDDGRRERERAEIAAALREPDRAAAIAILDRLLADDPGLSARRAGADLRAGRRRGGRRRRSGARGPPVAQERRPAGRRRARPRRRAAGAGAPGRGRPRGHRGGSAHAAGHRRRTGAGGPRAADAPHRQRRAARDRGDGDPHTPGLRDRSRGRRPVAAARPRRAVHPLARALVSGRAPARRGPGLRDRSR
ncbi:hypothetical protein OV079_11860 [Nannocystis pusilla]|uniref:Uncharacterized protein n=1 Tax=Nannocystis pusilla TaxID=889268 RepID=A0A9X3EVD2_9BACT|nr:hypothetical protein [Nannocystis pusilla]MCY1006243.1 hypothetical protein [Nannocystis pusilla]